MLPFDFKLIRNLFKKLKALIFDNFECYKKGVILNVDYLTCIHQL